MSQITKLHFKSNLKPNQRIWVVDPQWIKLKIYHTTEVAGSQSTILETEKCTIIRILNCLFAFTPEFLSNNSKIIVCFLIHFNMIGNYEMKGNTTKDKPNEIQSQQFLCAMYKHPLKLPESAKTNKFRHFSFNLLKFPFALNWLIYLEWRSM